MTDAKPHPHWMARARSAHRRLRHESQLRGIVNRHPLPAVRAEQMLRDRLAEK